jgi:hypothetical protein
MPVELLIRSVLGWIASTVIFFRRSAFGGKSMYALTNIDFSKPLGLIVSELLPELEFGLQNTTADAKVGRPQRGSSVSAAVSELDGALAIAVFAAP